MKREVYGRVRKKTGCWFSVLESPLLALASHAKPCVHGMLRELLQLLPMLLTSVLLRRAVRRAAVTGWVCGGLGKASRSLAIDVFRVLSVEEGIRVRLRVHLDSHLRRAWTVVYSCHQHQVEGVSG